MWGLYFVDMILAEFDAGRQTYGILEKNSLYMNRLEKQHFILNQIWETKM